MTLASISLNVALAVHVVRPYINIPLGPIRFHRQTGDRAAARSSRRRRRTQTSTVALRETDAGSCATWDAS